MTVKITANGIDTLQTNTVTAQKIVNNSITHDDMPEGTVIQAVSTLYSDLVSYTVVANVDTDVPGLSITVVPKLSSSKFLIIVRHYMEIADGWNVMFNIKRDGVRLHTLSNNPWDGLSAATLSYGGAVDNSSTPEMLNIQTLDLGGSVAGVPITYKLVSSSTAARTCWVNRTFSSSGQTSYENGSSEIIVLEFKGY